MAVFDRDRYVPRALAAYFRSNGHTTQEAPPSVPHSHVTVYQDKGYVLLRAAGGTLLAVYRITNQAGLRRLRRWPKPLMKEADG